MLEGKSSAEGKALLTPEAGEASRWVVLNISGESLGWKMHSRRRIRLTAREEKAYKAQLATTTSQ